MTQLERNVRPWRLRPIIKWSLAIAICGIGIDATRYQSRIPQAPQPPPASTTWIAEPDLSTNLLWLAFPVDTTIARIHPTANSCTEGRLLMLLNDGTSSITLRALASGDGCHDHSWHLVEAAGERP